MRNNTIATVIAALATFSMAAQAQIGYQVSLLNTATGEPRANVTVNAQVTITDSQDNTIYTGSQQATTNDFGVLSLAVGDANTFANADTGKMPFFISVSVDGTLIGRSQILFKGVVRVAESQYPHFHLSRLNRRQIPSYLLGEKLDGRSIFFVGSPKHIFFGDESENGCIASNGLFTAQCVLLTLCRTDASKKEEK